MMDGGDQRYFAERLPAEEHRLLVLSQTSNIFGGANVDYKPKWATAYVERTLLETMFIFLKSLIDIKHLFKIDNKQLFKITQSCEKLSYNQPCSVKTSSPLFCNCSGRTQWISVDG